MTYSTIRPAPHQPRQESDKLVSLALADPCASAFLKGALLELERRDPVDAEIDCMFLMRYCQARLAEAISS